MRQSACLAVNPIQGRIQDFRNGGSDLLIFSVESNTFMHKLFLYFVFIFLHVALFS